MLLAVLACLPAAAARAKVEYPPEWMVLGKANVLTLVTAVATVLAGVQGWCLAHPAVREPGFLRTKRGRWMLLLGAAIGVAALRLSAFARAAPADWAAFGACTLLRCLACVAAALALGFAAGLARRSPRAWWLGEAVALLVVAGVATALGWNLGEGGWMIARIAIGLGVASLLAAGIAALRTEASAPAMHCRVLRSGLAVTLAMVAIAGARLRTMGPRGLDRSEAYGAPAGTWVNVHGFAGWPLPFEPGYLMDLESGRWIRLGVTRYEGCLVEPPIGWLSAEGRLAAWSPTSMDGATPRAVFVADLDAPSPRPRRLACVRADAWRSIHLSPTGRRLLIPEEGRMALVDVAADHVVARLDDGSGGGLRTWRLDDAGRVDLARAMVDRRDRPLGCVELYTADIAHPTLHLVSAVEAPHLASPPKVAWMRFAGASRILIDWSGERGHATLALHDIESGALVASIVEPQGFRRDQVVSLRDDRLLHSARVDGLMSLVVYSGGGALERSIPLGTSEASLTLAGERSPARFVVGVSQDRESSVVLVDLDTGETESIAHGLACIDRLPDPDGGVGGPATRLFRETSDVDGSHGALVELDWDTGARRVALPR